MRKLRFAAAALLAVATHGRAQLPEGTWRYGLAAGTPIAGGFSPNNIVGIGRATWQPTKRFNLRGEVTAAHFEPVGGDFVETPPCPIACTPSSVPARPPNNIAGISGHIILNDDYVTKGESGGYYVLGGGVYRGMSSSSVGSVGGSIEAGLGFKFGSGSFEMKYVGIHHWGSSYMYFVPVTLGVAW